MATDPQLRRVYGWEGQFSDWVRSTLNLREARAVVKWACDKYGVPCPRVTQHEGKAYSYSQGALISFNTTQRNPAIALHEAAHYISDQLFPNATIAHHSPEWMGIYLWLLEGYALAPRTALHASAKACGIRWVPTWTMSPKRLRRGR